MYKITKEKIEIFGTNLFKPIILYRKYIKVFEYTELQRYALNFICDIKLRRHMQSQAVKKLRSLLLVDKLIYLLQR